MPPRELAATVVGEIPARRSWHDRYIQVARRANPALANKNLAAFTDGLNSDYAEPQQFFRMHEDSDAAFAAAITESFVQNRRPVADAFRDAAQRVNALNSRASGK